MATVHLSKSRFLLGLQCPKQLWIHCHDRAVVPEPDPATLSVLEQGREVGKWSRQLFPDRIDLADVTSLDAALAASGEALRGDAAVFEATLRHGRCVNRADILDPAGDGSWNLIEVKSSTEAKPVHLQDVAFQRYVCEGAGLTIRGCFLLLIDTNYVRNGPIEPRALFSRIDVTEQVAELLPSVEARVNELLNVIALPECPDVRIGPHCSEPHRCALTELCWGFLPQPSIFDLRGAGNLAWTLFERGVLRIEDIPGDFKLNGAQAIQAGCHRTGAHHVDVPAVRAFLDRLRYPLHFLDFETFQTAIPIFEHSRPYGQIPFQFSLHVLVAPGAEPVHHGFLAADQQDPRPALMTELQRRIGDEGSIVAYNMAFEMGRLRECAEFFPEFREWVDGLLPRFVDLFAPFRSAHYYHPAQHGSASLKAVLPALTGKTYDRLEIHDGGTASREFLRITFGKVSEAERSRVLRALEAYCSQDTRGMIDVLDALRGLCR
ncbi:MAG: DUF2779 domain-containing protein [Chthoniobacteraceae bacterium]